MKKYLKTSLYLLVAILVGVTAVYATSKLTPPGSVTNTMYSLTDIYNLASGTTATEGTGDIEVTPLSIVETGKTLTEVYDAVAEALQSIPPTLTWQIDPALNLCWSHGQYEIDSESCSIGSGWIDASEAQDGSLPLGAVEYCQYLNQDGTTLAITPQNIWHLPTIKEYQSITDFTRFNSATAVTGFAEDTNYWSSTEVAENPSVAWYWGSCGGGVNYNGKSAQYAVRCAH